MRCRIPKISNEFTPARERFAEFKSLLAANAESLFATSMTDLYIVRRSQILKIMDDEHRLAEPVSPAFENNKYLQLSPPQDYRLITYLRLSENLPESLGDLRRDGSVSDLVRAFKDNDDFMEELEIINPAWRNVL